MPGVFIQQRNGAESARLSIRGSGLGRQFQGGGLLLLQDGIPLNSADGSFDFQAIDPWFIDYVTVYRGANGMALGGTTLGGVINLGATLPNGTELDTLRLSTGSFDSQKGMAGFNLNNDSQFFRIRASHFNQDGFRVQNQQHSNRFDLQHVINTQSGTRHKLALFHLNTYAELPSSLSKALIRENPRQSRGFNLFGNFHRDLTLTRLAYQAVNDQFSVSAFVAKKRLENPVFTYINRDSNDAGMNLNWQHNDHALNLFSQWGDQDELRRENEGGSAGNVRLKRKQKAQTTTLSYLFDTEIGHWRSHPMMLNLSLQGVYAKRDVIETFPMSLKSQRNYSQINPRIGLLYQADNIQWFANLARSFEAPSFAELNNGNQPGINTPIKAQSGVGIEFGTRGVKGKFNWDLSIYYNQLKNEFIRFRFPDGATRTTNANNSIHWGIESKLNWQLADSVFLPGDQINFETSHQLNQFYLDNDPLYDNNDIPGVPEHYLQSRLVYQHPSGWIISPNIEWVPTAYYIDLANTFRTDNYLLTGLSLKYQNQNDIEFFIDAKNLNNQTYISTSLPIPDANGTDGNYFYSGEGRAFYAGIKWLF